MKTINHFLLLGAILLGSVSLYGQSNEYLDDAYLSRKDIEQRQAKARAKAEAERREHEEQLRKWREESAAREAAYRARQRSREIDAYNGILTREDSLRLEQDLKARDKERRIHPDDLPYYGEYSNRLGRFHGSGNTVIINNPRSVYMDTDDFYTGSRFGWGFGLSWGRPWHLYDGFGFSIGYYDPWYDDWYNPWSYRRFPYHYSYYPRYNYYYRDYPVYVESYSYTPSYRGASRSVYNTSSRSAYGAYQDSRRSYDIESRSYPNYNTGYSRSGSSYSGRGRSAHDYSNEGSSSRGGYRAMDSGRDQSSYSGASESRSSGSSSSGGSRGGGSHSRR